MNPFILLTTEQTRTAERLTIEAGTASAQLMERAGNAVAAMALQILAQTAKSPDQSPDQAPDQAPEGSTKPSTQQAPQTVIILCGTGNNGGDGFVAARLLKEHGINSRVLMAGEPDQLKATLEGDAKLMADLYDGPCLAFSPATPGPENSGPVNLGNADLIIDSLLGIGVNRLVDGPLTDVVNAVNAHPAPVLSVDLPTGICGDSGKVMGAAIRATWTLTFITRKPGHVLYPGRAFAGQTQVAAIGVSDSTLQQINPTLIINDLALWAQAWPHPAVKAQPMIHKYDRGSVAVLSGGPLQAGAARLSARGALRAGAGLVTLLSPAASVPAHASQITSIMLREVNDPQDITTHLGDPRITAVIAGPGLGLDQAAKDTLLACLRSPQSGNRVFILDADGLSMFADSPDTLFAYLTPHHILTPHEGEFARLFPDINLDLSTVPSEGRLYAARTAAARCGAIMVLKGPDTIIAHPDGRAAININAPTDLATAGSGDVLAGFIGGLAGMKTPGGAQMPPFEAACGGVWLHGAAGQQAGPGLIAEDLPDSLPHVFKKILSPQQQAKPASPD